MLFTPDMLLYLGELRCRVLLSRSEKSVLDATLVNESDQSQSQSEARSQSPEEDEGGPDDSSLPLRIMRGRRAAQRSTWLVTPDQRISLEASLEIAAAAEDAKQRARVGFTLARPPPFSDPTRRSSPAPICPC